jgi:hypothetical protein
MDWFRESQYMKDDKIAYLRVFNQFVKEVIQSSPPEWKGGIMTIHNDGELRRCELTSKSLSETIDVTEKLSSFYQEFPHFQQSLDSNGWIKFTAPFSIRENGYDTEGGSFEYPEGFFADRGNDTSPDESFWREQTQNNAWKESPSLLVAEFIMDYGLWLKSLANQPEPQQYIVSKDLNEKFCRKGHQIQLNYFDPIHTHNISREWVNGAETLDSYNILVESVEGAEAISSGIKNGSSALVDTIFRDSENFIERSFDYELTWENDRWFLVRINLKESYPM